jgi:hypothetical protein
MLRDLLTQIAWNKKPWLILDTLKYVDSEKRKMKIAQIMGGPSTNFKKNKTEIAFSPYPRESKTFIYIQNRQVKS